jgi:hypothetical protein
VSSIFYKEMLLEMFNNVGHLEHKKFSAYHAYHSDKNIVLLMAMHQAMKAYRMGGSTSTSILSLYTTWP